MTAADLTNHDHYPEDQIVYDLPIIRFEGDYLIALRLALSTTAAPDDTRPYLKGIYFDFAHGRMMAADGAHAFVAKFPNCDLPGDNIIVAVRNPVTGASIRKLPVTWVTADLDLNTMTLCGRRHNGALSELKLDRVDGNFPDLDQVISGFLKSLQHTQPREPVSLAVNIDLLASWAVGKEPALAITPVYKNNQAYGALVVIGGLEIDHIAVVMAMRWEAPNPEERAAGLISRYQSKSKR